MYMVNNSRNNFVVGESVIYPNHGIGIIEQVYHRKESGREESFYHLRIAANTPNNPLKRPFRLVPSAIIIIPTEIISE